MKMQARFVDLMYPIHAGTLTLPKPWQPWEQSTQHRHGDECCETLRLSENTNSNTDMYAPRCFLPTGKTFDQLEAEALVGTAFLIDFTQCAPRQRIEPEDLQKAIGNRIVKKVVLHYAWQKHWGSKAYHQDHPYLSQSAARWLVTMGVTLVAMDTPSPDNPKNAAGAAIDTPIHDLFLANNIVLIESLCGLHEIGVPQFELILLPGQSVNPTRCVAIVE
jgi:arylformamidase